jgi:hypothetical protein
VRGRADESLTEEVSERAALLDNNELAILWEYNDAVCVFQGRAQERKKSVYTLNPQCRKGARGGQDRSGTHVTSPHSLWRSRVQPSIPFVGSPHCTALLT